MSFSSDYIVECSKLGIVNQEDICNRIKNRVEEIDKELEAADKLRIEKMKLRQVLADLGDESVKRQRFVPDIPEIELDDDSKEAQELRENICKALEKHGPMTNREIIKTLGNAYEDSTNIFRAIKYLGTNEIIKRDSIDNENKILPGPKWNER